MQISINSTQGNSCNAFTQKKNTGIEWSSRNSVVKHTPVNNI
jgi:hypothetical protein